jgi:hypothetical protein
MGQPMPPQKERPRGGAGRIAPVRLWWVRFAVHRP